MSRTTVSRIALTTLVALAAVPAFAQEKPDYNQVTYAKGQQAQLIAVLKSDASQKDKADACRLLAIVGGKDAVAPLAALLDDEKLAHMARYGLEPNPDPSVNEALREAVGKLKGLHLVGVIGSLGVRKDAKSVDAIAAHLKDSDHVVASAAARALGRIGTADAAKAIKDALPGTDDACRLAFCDGLLRATENLASHDHKDVAIAIYETLSKEPAPPQVRAGAAKKVVMLRQVPGKGL